MLLHHESLQFSSSLDTFSLVKNGKREKRVSGEKLNKTIEACGNLSTEKNYLFIFDVLQTTIFLI